jgi:serine protease AprX
VICRLDLCNYHDTKRVRVVCQGGFLRYAFPALRSIRNISGSVFTPNYPFYDDAFTLLSTPERTGALPAYTGRGVVIAFIDSGFYPHPDLGDRVLAHVDATTNSITEGRRFASARDYSWHGQMTSVIACGDGRLSGGRYKGIASNAQLVLIKVSDLNGRIKEPDILRGLRWLINNHRRFNVRVCNISVGGDDESDLPAHPLHRAVRVLVDAGVMVTTAAGNSGRRLLLPPASAAAAITVGGVDDRNTADRTCWEIYPNAFGTAHDGTTKPEVIGPAAWIASPILPGSSMAREARWLAPMLRAGDRAAVGRLLLSGHGDLSIPRAQAIQPDARVYEMLQKRIYAHKLVDAQHQHVDGTSVSSAILASIVAQMLEARPALTPAQVRAILTATAWPLPGVPPERQGAGVVDAAAAVRMAAEYTGRERGL